jgi:class 3 adenylate cyclase
VILISGACRSRVDRAKFSFIDRGRVTLRGFSRRFRLYEVDWRSMRLAPASTVEGEQHGGNA